MDIIKKIAKSLDLKERNVENAIKLLDEGNTIPFIARYRKELTGEMTDVKLRELDEKLTYLRNLEKRKEDVIRLIDEQGKLTDELREEIEKSESLQRIEDLYRPFKPKRRTKATIAREKGLDKLAEVIMANELEDDKLLEFASTFINEENDIKTIEDAFNGAKDIIAEDISDDANIRNKVREYLYKHGIIVVKAIDENLDSVYEMYYDYKEPIKNLANHRILAINRGENKKALKVSLETPDFDLTNLIKEEILKNKKSLTNDLLEQAIEDSFKRLLFPSIEREIRSDLTQRAEEEAIKVFALNLEPLLMQPPIKGKAILAIDPGFRTGLKVVVLDETGKLLSHTNIFPVEPHNKIEESESILLNLVNEYNVEIIAIGNGTASRETESFVVEFIKKYNLTQLSYIIVNEAGASIYSASEIGQKEFPDKDVTVRGAVSIGRRVLDPLAELVKIEPKHIGVGQYQHDLNQKRLDEVLSKVVEDCVNRVGVNLNTASISLLKYVSGINSKLAENIVAYREENGKFTSREELSKIKGMGEKTFKQCAGFLRIPESDNILDNTSVHPESYDIAHKLLNLNYKSRDIDELARELNIGKPTLVDIIKELEKPGRDLREDRPKPILRSDVLKIEDLEIGMELLGTVRNVVDFGAFVDIGVKEDGLVHISEISEKYIKHPKEVLKVGDIVKVRIIKIDLNKGRISLSMKGISQA
ncbi:MAG: RNA-binding transcriptional accessory protein [Tissierellales bacterium]|nr:RNA-binding transcriptional accessory protein [Tissierellales bacterium]